MLAIRWVQHAVGHGGFHAACARSLDVEQRFNWIFDCGARKATTLDALLKDWTASCGDPVDWLFVSHFDHDHVSGLDVLMARASVRDVMVPYVNDRELAFQLLHEISRGNLVRAFFELVADPAAFFLGRGAERVTFLRGRRRGGPAAEGEPDAPVGEGGWTVKIQPAPKPMPSPAGFRTSTGSASRVRLIEGRCTITVINGASGIVLKPFRASISPRAHQGLVEDLRTLVGSARTKAGRPGLGELAFAVAHHARSPSGRAELRRLYGRHVGSSNRSSLSLLSEPRTNGDGSACWSVRGLWGFDSGRGDAGWLSTGDAELLDAGDLAEWESAFAAELARVRVLSLPHHGSDRNSNERLQRLCPAALLTALVKSGAKKHPGPRNSAIAGHRLWLVNEHNRSRIEMTFEALL